jgi:hypothetical protein
MDWVGLMVGFSFNRPGQANLQPLQQPLFTVEHDCHNPIFNPFILIIIIILFTEKW